jgi:hypothetical protein
MWCTVLFDNFFCYIIDKRNKTKFFFYYFAPFCDVNFLHSLCSEANILKRIKANRIEYSFSFEANQSESKRIF